VEYLYFHAVQRSIRVDPKKGVTVPAITDALKAEGQPVEAGWPYLLTLPTDLSKWQPPKRLTVFKQSLSAGTQSVAGIISAIDDAHGVLLCLKISAAFYGPDELGVVAHIKNDPDTGYHAMVAVAHGTAGSESLILVRNSWGADWGLNGHAWLQAPYVSKRLHSIWIIG
jgi:hypothetical protein